MTSTLFQFEYPFLNIYYIYYQPTVIFRSGDAFVTVMDRAFGSFLDVSIPQQNRNHRRSFGRTKFYCDSPLRQVLLKDKVQPWIDKVTAAGVLRGTFKPPSVIGGLKGIWQAVENYCHTMQLRNGGDLPTFMDAHSKMGRQGILQAVENYRHTMQLRNGGDLPTFEEAHSEMGRQGILQAVENYRLTMQRRKCGDLPTFEEAHSEMGRQGIWQAVENYRLTMQRRECGDLPTFEEAHSEMGRKGLLNQVEDTRIAMQEQVGVKVSSEMALSVHQAINGTGNRGKPRGNLTFYPSSITMIEQFADQEFVTPVPESPDNPNRVYSRTNGDIAYALYQRGVVASTAAALNHGKMTSYIRQAKDNLGPIKYADLVFRSQKHNGGASYYIRFTVLEEIPPVVAEAPKRPDSDKNNRKKNKVVKDDNMSVDRDDDDNGGGGVTLSIAQVSSIKATRKTNKSVKVASWSNFKTNAKSEKRTEVKDEKSSTWKKTKNERTKKRKTNEEVEDEEVEVDEWEEVDDEEEEEWSPDDN